MSKWLDTIGNTVLSIAICDRCKMKRAYSDISEDRNIPGLRVCSQGCNDERDPYRLPARQPEKIAIRFPRPDADVSEGHDAIVTDPNSVAGISPETSIDTIDGNLDNLSP